MNIADYIEYAAGWIRANYSAVCVGAYVPCSSGEVQIIEMRTPICFYRNDEAPYDFLYCNRTFCVEVYEVCTNQDGSVTETLINAYTEGSIGCPQPPDPPPFNECYYIYPCFIP